MTDYLTNPHDKFFKDLFSRQEAARDFLQHYLPAEVAALLDLSTLQIQKDSFIDPDLHEHFSDLLYQVRLDSGQETYIYVLFEHKSYADPLIALQLLKYMVRIWEQALKQEQGLLPVFPLVVYHGRQRWRVAREFSALFELPAALQGYLPDYRYHLADLSQYSDEQIKQRVERAVILQIGLLSLKYVYAEDVGEQLAGIIGLAYELLDQETALEYVETILRYMAASSDKLSEETLRTIILKMIEEGDKLMPTLAEQWLEQGRLEGREEGREEGRLEGRDEGQREATLTILQRYLATRFDIDLHHFDTDLNPLDLATLTALSERAFTATTLAEFQAALTEVTTSSSLDQTP